MAVSISHKIGSIKKKVFWTANQLFFGQKPQASLPATIVARPFPVISNPFKDIKERMLTSTWGMIQPQDKLALMEGLVRVCADTDEIVICELGVAAGLTGNRLVEFADAIGAKKVLYFGVDDLTLTGKIPEFQYADRMNFVDGGSQVLSRIQTYFNFALVDACHCSECVYHDSIAMSQRISVGGMMAFHDTSMACQYPNSPLGQTHWQHYCRGSESERPLAVLEGLAMARHEWLGRWRLVIQEGDHLEWGGVRIFQRQS